MAHLALGLAALGRPAYINLGRAAELPGDRDPDAMEAACTKVLDAAYDAGLRHVDVARSYGLAEDFLAAWLAATGHDDVFVSSKWGYDYVGGWRLDADVHEQKEHSFTRFTDQWAITHRMLGDRVGLYQVHSLTTDSALFDDTRLLEAMAHLRDSGVRLGFSTSGPEQAEAVERGLAVRVAGVRLFDAVQSTWNVLERSAGHALEQAHRDGVQVLIKEALANGRLAVDAPAALQGFAAERGVGVDAVSLALVMAQPWVDTVVLGPASVAQLTANLGCRDLQVEPDVWADVVEPPEAYWKQRAALPWT